VDCPSAIVTTRSAGRHPSISTERVRLFSDMAGYCAKYGVSVGADGGADAPVDDVALELLIAVISSDLFDL